MDMEVPQIIKMLYEDGMLEKTIDIAVNGPKDEDGNVIPELLNRNFLAWYPGSAGWLRNQDTMDRNVVAAAFHMLGNEIAENAHPVAAYAIILHVIQLRNAALELMKGIPR